MQIKTVVGRSQSSAGAALRLKNTEALAKATNAQALKMNFKGIFLDEGRRILGVEQPLYRGSYNSAFRV